MPTWSRRRIETTGLSAIALASVWPLREPVEDPRFFFAEAALTATFAAIALFLRGCRTPNRFKHVPYWRAGVLPLIPLVPLAFAFATRRWGTPVAYELATLTAVAAVALAMAIGARRDRTRSLSLVLSGFLVLFIASISEGRYALVVPLIWMLGCMWHLIANQWERLDAAMPESVHRDWTLRPKVLIVAAVVLLVGAYAVKGKISESSRLTAGVMPTSGGSKWSDPAARDGVGSGDAAIAAKDHAESFGAVESDLFLESTESTLFDMVNDSIGEPKVKFKWERRQAMGSENFISAHEESARSDRGGGSFSTERMPPKKHRHLDDAVEDAVVQWDGSTGIRLAMRRYDTFDGTNWTQANDYGHKSLTRVGIDQKFWFFDPDLRRELEASPESVSIGLLKVLRLKTPRIPVPAMTAGIHVKQVDRQDFFAVDRDGSFFMPGREKVPSMTVIHVASLKLTEDKIRERLQAVVKSPARRTLRSPGDGDAIRKLRRIAVSVTADVVEPYDQVNAIIDYLRTEFFFERDGDGAAATNLDSFLEDRRGGDHLFATAAAIMTRAIGFDSRLVTGFYVRPDAFDFTAGYAGVIPDDIHFWAEVSLGDGRWFEVEPTPGYREPDYRPTWRLLAKQFVMRHWPIMGLTGSLGCIGMITRRIWIDWLLAIAWRSAGWLRPRRRLRLGMSILEIRARMAGRRRPAGQCQRVWMESLAARDQSLVDAVGRFFDRADAIFFGSAEAAVSPDDTRLVNLLRIPNLRRLNPDERS